MPDWLRLSIGTFTRLPVPAPRRVDGSTARWAMIAAPVVGALLGGVTGLPLLVASNNVAASLLLAAIAVTAGAVTTRALHWDGLADTADAIASGKPREQALEVARRADLGPVGALALIVFVLIQVTGLAALAPSGAAYGVWIVACTVGRAGVVMGCTPRYPAARKDGLGAAVAGSVPLIASATWTAIIVAVGIFGIWQGTPWLAAGMGGLFGAWVLLSHARRRFGGVTGDIFGATVEIAVTSVIITGTAISLFLTALN